MSIFRRGFAVINDGRKSFVIHVAKSKVAYPLYKCKANGELVGEIPTHIKEENVCYRK